MTTVLIIILVVLILFMAASVALGRGTYEVESARDTEYLELEGLWVRYSVMGGGPPVVLVHGWLSSSRVWEQLAGRLAQRFTVYTLDLPGFGESDKPLSGYGVRYGSRILYAFCAHFGLTRASVIGHDVGGDIAVKLAADHPDVVGRLVLVSAPADEDQIDLPTPLWLATLPVVGPVFYALGRLARPVRVLWTRPFVAEPEELPEEVVEDAGRSTPAAVGKTLSVALREISGGRLVRQARLVKVPVLLLAGEEDQIVDPQAVGDWSRGAEQAEVGLMDECGHLPMIERPDEFNAQILAFLTGDNRYLERVRAPAEPEEEQPEGQPDEKWEEQSYDAREEPEETLEMPEERHSSGEHVSADDQPEDPGVIFREPEKGNQPQGADYSPEPGNDEEPGDEHAERREERPPRERPRRRSSDKGYIPEIPEDLFDWSSREGSQRRSRRARREEPPEHPSEESGGENGHQDSGDDSYR